MSRVPRRHQVISASGAAITASSTSSKLNNLNNVGPQTEMEAILSCAGPVTGTTPSLTVSIYEVDPVTGLDVLMGSFTPVTGVLANPLRLPFNSLFGFQFHVGWVVSGTSPSFSGVELDLYHTPDI